ncbi:glutathione S-transferase TAU 19 [Prunus dulcis]|uniref:glutathione transferase n=1 Tax=Prunus dulcis TaxID=3755 RepID=A0A4Y1QNX9_PRUDU|nr:glutathione S-transferase TAU 19 [Prunus dulcis]
MPLPQLSYKQGTETSPLPERKYREKSLCLISQMDEDEVVLLGFWTSPYVMRVKIALAEKGVHYYYMEEGDLFKNKSTLLLKMNPVFKKVPVIIHNDKSICESLIILQYIDDVWNDGAPILSEDPYQRAKARFWIDFLTRRMWASKGADQEAAKKEFIESLKLLEGELGEKPYFGGDRFGLLDIALVPFSCRFYTYETLCNFSVEKECPKLIEWVKRCSLRESVSKSLPDQYKVYDFVLEFKKMLGIN